MDLRGAPRPSSAAMNRDASRERLTRSGGLESRLPLKPLANHSSTRRPKPRVRAQRMSSTVE